jgi:IMP dehydrogenase
MKPIQLALSYNDVLLKPQLSSLASRSDVDLTTQITQDISLKIPLIAVGMDTVVGINMAVTLYQLGCIAFYPRFITPEQQANAITKIVKKGAKVIGSIGIRDGFLERAEMLLKAGSSAFTIDIAHAHTTPTLQKIAQLKNRFPQVSLIAGTIATYEGAYDLFQAGVDTVRVGVGVGTICTTRIMTGSGVPQITALLEATRAKKQFKNRFILADGGTANSGDIMKGLACGASGVVIGSLFAGTDEAPGKLIEKNGNFFKEYNGSTSLREKQRQLEKDGAGKKPSYVLHVEGVEGMVQYKGPVKDVIAGLEAGMRSGFTYSGAQNIEELHSKAQFLQITAAGLRESQAHDITLRT